MTYVLNAGWAWAALMVFFGLVARQALGGIVTSLLAAFSACAAYYPPDFYQPVNDPNSIMLIDEDGAVSVSLPDWLDESLNVHSPEPEV